MRDLKMFRRNGYRVLLLSGSRTRAKRLAEDLRDQELTAIYTEDPLREIQAGEVVTYYGHVDKGFEYPLLKFVVLSETDIFGAEKKKKRAKRLYEGQKIKDFNELKVGDYVVHESHGLGVYQGIEKVEMEGVVKAPHLVQSKSVIVDVRETLQGEGHSRVQDMALVSQQRGLLGQP